VKGYRLVAAILPGRNGSLEIGQRQITFAWFEEVRQDLNQRIMHLWPEVWAESVAIGVQSREVLSGSPIAEYQAIRLAKGRLAIIGDAAHAASPMTGSGFASSVDDAASLSRLLAKKSVDESIETALARYELARLPYSRRLLASSLQASEEFIRYAQSGG
jgi:2-polyprenyl-6-methoxyphenol hydroxylase-like FAD-dependent oxidoreductase